jgi:Na+-translocating ferredoxin:NAD+ oxidoreductase subunit E
VEEKMSANQGMARGLWKENALLTLLLGLCPALAVSARLSDAIVLSLGVLFVLPAAALLARPISRVKRAGLQSYLSVAAVAAAVTVYDFLVRTGLPMERARLGIYVPILAANCLILGRFFQYSRLEDAGEGFRDALGTALGYAVVLLVIAAVREMVGAGRLTLFPVGSFSGTVSLGIPEDVPVRMAALPAGGLILLGFLVGLKRAISGRKGRPR